MIILRDCKTLVDGEMMPHEPQLYELTRKVWILQMSIQGHIKVHQIQIHLTKSETTNIIYNKVANNMLHFLFCPL